MIIGIGSDLCNIERIEKSLARWSDKLLQRVFTETERKKAASRPHTAAGTLCRASGWASLSARCQRRCGAG